MLQRRSLRLQHRDENVEKHTDLFLQIPPCIRFPRFQISKWKRAMRTLSFVLNPESTLRKHPQGNPHADLKQLWHRTDRLPTERQIEVLVFHLDERGRVWRAAGIDDCVRVDEDVHMGVEDNWDHVERAPRGVSSACSQISSLVHYCR